MPLLEHEAQRLAAALDDYDNVAVTDIGGTQESGFWVVGHDQRFDLRYLIDSHTDYWDFVAGLAVGRPRGAATSPASPLAAGPASQAAILAANGRAAGPASPAAASIAGSNS